jgi:hypothetical protein
MLLWIRQRKIIANRTYLHHAILETVRELAECGGSIDFENKLPKKTKQMITL